MSYILSEAAKFADRKKLFLEFGKLSSEDVASRSTSLSNNQLEILFEEYLLAKFVLDKELLLPLDLFKDVIPFSAENLSCNDFFAAENASFAIFPLDSSANNKRPPFAHLWLFEGLDEALPDHRSLLDGNDILNKGTKIFISRSDKLSEKIAGRSWQLAAKMAERALKESDNRKKLPEWMISGVCSEDAIKRVHLGNKLDIALQKKWLMPLENKPDIGQKYQHQVIRFADDIESAWSHISRQSHKSGENLDWEEQDYRELHLLVGGIIKANISSAILASVSKIVLWGSDNDELSQTPARHISEVIKTVKPGIDVCTMPALPSVDLCATESRLLAYFSEIDEKVLFNVTSSNRLMSYAVLSCARLYPNIELIYKEQGDNEPGSFVHFNYNEFPPYSAFLKAGKIPENYNWQFLNNRERYTTAEDFLEKLLNTSSS